MKNFTFKTLFASLFLLVGVSFAPQAFGQSILPNTTLSTALSTSSGKVIVVASATGITAPSTSDGTKLTYLWIDKEALEVQAVNGTNISVARGVNGTGATPHVSGALVLVIQASKATFFGFIPTGSCTRSNELLLPRIHFASGVISDCLGGQWVQGDSQQTSRTVNSSIPIPNTGGTAYTSINSTGTAPSATVMNCTEVVLPYNKLLTGIGILNGTAIGTDNHLVALYDSTGNLIANSAVAGVLAASASTYQQISFTSKYYAVGPATYFACMQSNGTTATVRMIVTGTQDTFLTKGVTGQTFGTLASFTVPTTFTTAVGPYVSLF